MRRRSQIAIANSNCISWEVERERVPTIWVMARSTVRYAIPSNWACNRAKHGDDVAKKKKKCFVRSARFMYRCHINNLDNDQMIHYNSTHWKRKTRTINFDKAPKEVRPYSITARWYYEFTMDKWKCRERCGQRPDLQWSALLLTLFVRLALLFL